MRFYCDPLERREEKASIGSPGSQNYRMQGTSTQGHHPSTGQLQRFLRGEASRDEVRAIVRHLLAGCLECTALMGPICGLAERWPKALPVGNRKESTRLEREAVR